MEKEIISRMEKLLDRELDTEEKERLQRIQDTLQIADNDALWAVISAMEYQRAYYETLPEKISSVTEKILAELSIAAEKEVRFAQSRLAENVVKQVEKLSWKRHIHTWRAWGTAALFLLLLYGSCLMWAGFCLGSGQVQPHDLLKMPVGFVLAALCLCGGSVFGVVAARAFADMNRIWRKYFIVAGGCFIFGGAISVLTLA